MNFKQYIVKIRIMDNSVLNEIKKKYDLTKDEDVLALFAALQAGQYRLVTREEMAFDDEIYERAMAIKEKQKKQKKADAVSAQGKKTEKRTSKKVVVLTRNELKAKRAVTMFLFLAAAGCLLYFGWYCYEA